MDSFNREFYTIVVLMIIFTLGMEELAKGIEESGGLGKAIGRFLQDIENPN